jgi:hypothetical protein
MDGRNKTIDFNLADRLLCAMNMTDLWRTTLSHLYETVQFDDSWKRHHHPDTTGEKTCGRRGCSVRFTPPANRPGKKYCTPACCAAAYWQKKHGVKTQIRGKNRQLEKLVCRNGHERTPGNTRFENGVRRCLVCKHISDSNNNRKTTKPQPLSPPDGTIHP